MHARSYVAHKTASSPHTQIHPEQHTFTVERERKKQQKHGIRLPKASHSIVWGCVCVCVCARACAYVAGG
ncbi:MAG: hypothetical protein ACRC4N_01255 [Gammaproteobacteria bacterium]